MMAGSIPEFAAKHVEDKKFKADAGSLERAIEYCSSYVVVHSSDGAAYAQKRPPPGAAGATAFSART